jgi:hypothetical protein
MLQQKQRLIVFSEQTASKYAEMFGGVRVQASSSAIKASVQLN